jgi:hypothetical protein
LAVVAAEQIRATVKQVVLAVRLVALQALPLALERLGKAMQVGHSK